MEVEKSNLLVKVGLAVTTGMSAIFAAYLVTEQIRKHAKQKEKSDMKRMKKEIERKILQAKQDATLHHTKSLPQCQSISSLALIIIFTYSYSVTKCVPEQKSQRVF